MSTWIDLHAVGMIVGFGLLAGAGLPALFALGLRALNASGNGGEPPAESSSAIVGGSTAGLAVAVTCFAVVVAAIAWGFYFIIAG